VADLRLGPIEARIAPEDVAAYRRATGLDGAAGAGSGVPATFPAVWLWHPKAAAAVAQASRCSGQSPVLTAQRFAYFGPLAIGALYRFEIERFRHPDDPDEVSIEATVRDEHGQLVASFSAVFRLFAAALAEASA
jgi:hypothetical protein